LLSYPYIIGKRTDSTGRANNPFIEFDFSRERIRRSLCYMALAFLPEQGRRDYTLAKYARNTLNDVDEHLKHMMRMTADFSITGLMFYATKSDDFFKNRKSL